VDARVLIPRPDTETLVDVALARTKAVSLSMRALDLCTGSGCVGVTLAKERPTSSVLATDLSEGALTVARANALRLGAYNASFALGDLYGAVPAGARFDVVTANPPYIASREVDGLDVDIRSFEPHLALDGGDDGLTLVRRVVDGAPAHLAPGGVLAVEIGANEARATMALFEARGFRDVRATRDLAGIERVVDGTWGHEPTGA
jgi:release factor glutamine methyltransferase